MNPIELVEFEYTNERDFKDILLNGYNKLKPIMFKIPEMTFVKIKDYIVTLRTKFTEPKFVD